MDNLIIVYRLVNFTTGKAFETKSKSMMVRYISMGYKLITVGFYPPLNTSIGSLGND